MPRKTGKAGGRVTPAEQKRRVEQAAQPQPGQIQVSSEGLIESLKLQRNNSQDEVAFWRGRAMDLEAYAQRLQSELDELMRSDDAQEDEAEGDSKAQRSKVAKSGGHRKNSKPRRASSS